jgi:hypothetical protein
MVMGMEITRAQGAAATMKTVARPIHSAHSAPNNSGGTMAMRMPANKMAGL